MAERELRFEQKMSDAEAMMWNVEHDPRLSSNIGSIAVLDQPLRFDELRARVATAVADIPRLRERVAPVLGRLAPPVWMPDPEFDLDFHVRRIALAPPGPGGPGVSPGATDRQLLDLCTTLLQEPFDRTRPLWIFYVIEGLTAGSSEASPSKGRGALLTKMHHTVTDGEGGIRLAERYMELERDTPPPDEVDLKAVIEKANEERKADESDDFASSALRTAGHTLRRLTGMVRRTAGEVALAASDPVRLTEGVRNVTKAITSARDQMTGEGPGSPLWRNRSRARVFDVMDVPLEPARAAAKKLGGSLNDFFVAGAALGAIKYHEFCGVEAPFFNATFVVSTRGDGSAGGNAFTPSVVKIPGEKMDLADRFAAIRDAMGGRRGEVTGGADLMGAVSGIANLLPTSVITGIGRSQAARIDFATSNVRGAPFEVFVSGGKCIAFYPMGPVAGTGWNITMMSYAGTLFMGVHIDPAAVEDTDLLMRSLRAGYRELLSSSGAS